MSTANKKIKIKCPSCNKTTSVKINKTVINEARSFPTSIAISHCNQTLIAYIDAKFQVKAVEAAMLVLNI